MLALVPVGLGSLLMTLAELRGGSLERTFETMGRWGSQSSLADAMVQTGHSVEDAEGLGINGYF